VALLRGRRGPRALKRNTPLEHGLPGAGSAGGRALAPLALAGCARYGAAMLSIAFSSVFVDDQTKAADFYTRVLGFELCADLPLGQGTRWLTVRSSTTPGSVELVLEPNGNPVAVAYQQGLRAQGIASTSFATDDIIAEVARLKALGVVFAQEPTDIGPAILATFDDTCGNLIQIAQSKAQPPA